MKYMTFNSSCSYAGIANMLELYGVETSDRDIALTMKLPYLFSFSDDMYSAGPMLQSAEWFNLYLNPIGYQLYEKMISADQVVDYLKSQKTAMLGIKTENEGKHAVVYIGTEENQLIFINNKWKSENTPNEIRLSEEQLKQRIESKVMVATLIQITPKKVRYTDKMQTSIIVLQRNLSEIIELCHKEENVENLRAKLNTLFRPLFLDGINMLNLIGEMELSCRFTSLQQELLNALRQDSTKMIFLKDYISIDKLQSSVENYIKLIRVAIETSINE